jgi:hypothetical protein
MVNEAGYKIRSSIVTKNYKKWPRSANAWGEFVLKHLRKLFEKDKSLPARFDDGDDFPSYVPPNGAGPRDPYHSVVWQGAIGEWMQQLPETVRPVCLNASYPRIVAKLMKNWPDRMAIDAYLSDLLIDQRGNRKGFPPKVTEELRSLQRYSSPYAHESVIRTLI